MSFYDVQGIFASDVDGTISFQGAPIASELIEMFSCLYKTGWILLFATGRTEVWAKKHLISMSFPHYISPFNGAVLWQIQEDGTAVCLYSYVITHASIQRLFPLMSKYGALIYEANISGKRRPRIFSVTKSFSPKMRRHLEVRRNSQNENWIEVENMLPDDLEGAFSIRFFFEKDASDSDLFELLSEIGLQGASMKDSFDHSIRIVQVTSYNTTKKTAVDFLKNIYKNVPVVGMGDDINDIPMLEVSDRAIAISGAESKVLDVADYITKSTDPEAIIETVLHSLKQILK